MPYDVVLHDAYGGFSLSDAAVTRIAELLDDKDLNINNHLLEMWLPRNHPALVQTVKELGGKAHGNADGGFVPEDFMHPFKIVQVEDEYEIHEYDGMEYVTEPQNIRWKKASVFSLDSMPWYMWKPGTEQHRKPS